MAVKQREECLEVLGRVLPEDEQAVLAFARAFRPKKRPTFKSFDGFPTLDADMVTREMAEADLADRYGDEDDEDAQEESVNLVSSLCLLMGETFEAVGNRDNAAFFFRLALKCDARNTEVPKSLRQHRNEVSELTPLLLAGFLLSFRQANVVCC